MSPLQQLPSKALTVKNVLCRLSEDCDDVEAKFRLRGKVRAGAMRHFYMFFWQKMEGIEFKEFSRLNSENCANKTELKLEAEKGERYSDNHF